MKAEDILKLTPTVLSEKERRQFFRDGYLVLPEFIQQSWLTALTAAMNELIEQSRQLKQSNQSFTLEDSHSFEEPKLHRITSPQDLNEIFWNFFKSDEMTALASDVVGPDVKFHHAKLNVKSGDGSRGFKWHQDIQAWPHTDYSPVTIGLYLNGCRKDQGPLSFVPGSHNGPLYSMYNESGQFVVRIADADLSWLTEAMIDRPTGGPGTLVLLSCRIIHGSSTNHSNEPRPLLLSVYSSADSFPYTPSPINSRYYGEIVRGNPAQFASFDTRPCELPPDWRAGYQTAWTYQKQEDNS